MNKMEYPFLSNLQSSGNNTPIDTNTTASECTEPQLGKEMEDSKGWREGRNKELGTPEERRIRSQRGGFEDKFTN